MEKFCLNCGEKVIGRSDKKFCSDQCRSAYYNQNNQEENSFVRGVVNILKKNRRILAALNPNGKARVRQSELLQQGFDFKYVTNIYKTKTGNEYFFCFDQGYLKIDDEYYALVVRQEFV